MTCLTDERRRQFHKDLLQRATKDWERFKSNETNHRNLEHHFHYHKKMLASPRAGVDDISPDDFDELMSAVNRVIFDEVFAKMKTPPVELSTDMPLYFWLADGLRAVFSIPSLSDEATEYGFVTGKARLITAFQNMRDRYLRRMVKK